MMNFLSMLGKNAASAAEFALYGYPLGTVKEDSYGNRYKFVKYDGGAGGITAALGAPVGVYASANVENTVTADLSDSSESLFRGLAASVFSEAADRLYGWILIEGDLKTALNGAGLTPTTDGGVDQGEFLYWSADGVIAGLGIAGSPADHAFFGQAGAADTATPVLAQGQVFGAVMPYLAA